VGSTSLSLLEGLKVQDREGWRRLVHLYGPLVYGWCRRKGLPPSDAEDLVQEVFLTVVKRVVDFRRDRAGDTFRGWLRTITRHKLGDWFRRRHTELSSVAFDLQGHPLWQRSVEFDDDADSEDTVALYHRALELIRSEFNQDSWHAFWRIVVENKDPAEVATELRTTRNAVYLAKSRVLRRLREALGDV